MNLLIQPDAGITPILTAIKKARRQVELVIFRFDLNELEKALEAAVARGVLVHALIAHTNQGGEKRLRKLELALLAAGVTVSRTDDDLVRYHGKLLIIDRTLLGVLGFNYTKLDVSKSRSFGVFTKHKKLVQEAVKLFEADSTRQAYTAGLTSLVVSPENARTSLSHLIKRARKQLLIYDPKIADSSMIRLLQDRAKAGVDIRILGKLAKRGAGLQVEKLPKPRLHVRAMLRDGRELFIGSQSLRAAELDKRREVGVIVRDASAARQLREAFERDWARARAGSKPSRKENETNQKEARSRGTELAEAV
jgi:phosphatidylserine/phosphatidylglycerophosphate/cardiolipin synthase-like enzyme